MGDNTNLTTNNRQIDYLDKGAITITGEIFKEDMIVAPSRVTSWRRGRALSLSINDFQSVISERPATLVIGIGIEDNLQIDEFTKTKLKDLGFDTYIAKTRTAVKQYNRICEEKKAIGLFHIT